MYTKSAILLSLLTLCLFYEDSHADGSAAEDERQRLAEDAAFAPQAQFFGTGGGFEPAGRFKGYRNALYGKPMFRPYINTRSTTRHRPSYYDSLVMGKRFPEIDEKGFHENIFDEGFGGFSPVKRA